MITFSIKYEDFSLIRNIVVKRKWELLLLIKNWNSWCLEL